MQSSGNWGLKPSRKAEGAQVAAALDTFVNPTVEKGATKRLNAEIPIALHTRLKAACALEGRTIAEVLLELLEQRFPA